MNQEKHKEFSKKVNWLKRCQDSAGTITRKGKIKTNGPYLQLLTCKLINAKWSEWVIDDQFSSAHDHQKMTTTTSNIQNHRIIQFTFKSPLRDHDWKNIIRYISMTSYIVNQIRFRKGYKVFFFLDKVYKDPEGIHKTLKTIPALQTDNVNLL